jgi:hypothetical protein
VPNTSNLIASIVAIVAGALAYLWSVVLAAGLLAGGYILLGVWLDRTLSDRDLRQRLLDAARAELVFNRVSALEVQGLAERGKLSGSVSTPLLRTSALFEVQANISRMRINDDAREGLTRVAYRAERVNDALRTMRRFQLDVTNAKAQNLENIQRAALEFVKEYSISADELRNFLGPAVKRQPPNL